MHDLRRLQVLAAVAEHGSFSAAAVELGYAQSVVSHHVAALEHELGVRLVDRGSRPVQLTEAGERLREHARAILSRVGDAEAEIRAIGGLSAGSLRMSAFLAAGISFIPEVVRDFCARYPAIDLQLEQRSSDAALEELRAGALDLAVLWTPERARDVGEALASEVVGLEPYRIVLPSSHRLARRRSVALADLAGEPFTYPRESREANRYTAWLRERCAEAGFEPDLRYPVDDVMVGHAFVATGLCVGVLPHLAVSGGRAAVQLRPLPGEHSVRAISAVWRAGRDVPAVPPMLAMLRSAVPAYLARVTEEAAA